MSTDFTNRPVGAPAPSPVVPPPSRAANEAVTTVLPARQSVTATDAGVAANNDPQIASGDLSHQAFFDRDAAAVMVQAGKSRTDQGGEEYSGDALLRRRAQFHNPHLSQAS